MITYTESTDDVTIEMLIGFFVGWPKPPSAKTHLHLLHNSSHVVLAVDDEIGRVVGFINAVSDGVLCAYLPLLEVLPDYQGRGIGTELLRRMLTRLDGLYMIDLMCDPELQPYYERVGMKQATGMSIRDYDAQAGKPAGTAQKR